MKRAYQEPKIDVINLTEADIIVTSQGDNWLPDEDG
jgi:hypothetical protein